MERTDLHAGDRLILSAGERQHVWTVSAVNNQVVKYFDETGSYGQMPWSHLTEMLRQKQAVVTAPAEPE